MEASASPGTTSSQATQTGRPSLWTESDQRKLGRLYVYTTLPLKKILDVIQASSPTDEQGPGKDSANKKLNALLDKEPRWLHPRTRTDMERRMNELGHSPTRARDAQTPLGRPHGESISSDPATSPTQQLHQEATYMPYEPMAGILHNGNHGPPGPPGPPSQPGSSRVSWNESAAPTADLTLQTEQPPDPARQSRYNSVIRRSTVMTTSSAVSTTLQRALSEYSNGFVRQVKRVIKRYTMPTNTAAQHPSPILETRPSTADSMRGSWVHDEHAPPSMSAAPPLPGEFLWIDQLLLQQGQCMELTFEHATRNCLCRAAAEMKHSCWMSETGLSAKAELLLQRGAATAPDFALCDVFGNTLLHLLVARDADHMYVLEVVSSGIDCRQRNSAGQTFLHLLHPTWLYDQVNGIGPLTTLLTVFNRDPSFFLARDVYGQTFLHALRSKIEEPTAFNQILRTFNIDLFRDAFGSSSRASDSDQLVMKPMRRAFTTVMDEDTTAPMTSPNLPRLAPDVISTHARLLEFVTKSQSDPLIEDAYGRNGLHCLAAAVLSDMTLLRKTGQASDEQQSRNKKRKRESSPSGSGSGSGSRSKLKHTDSSKERLSLRENIVHNLLAAGVNVNHYDHDGNTVLMAFVAQLPEDDDYKVPVSILQMLLHHGADIHARNRRGETALHIAVRRGRKLAMRTLVQYGANVHVRDAGGRSLLDIADEKMRSDADNKAYMHYEACRAWLSGQGRAVQDPTLVQEWTPATRSVA